ncbi:hypothetical protein ACOSQ3_017168 [Xanthoceras sorbifolium]
MGFPLALSEKKSFIKKSLLEKFYHKRFIRKVLSEKKKNIIRKVYYFSISVIRKIYYFSLSDFRKIYYISLSVFKKVHYLSISVFRTIYYLRISVFRKEYHISFSVSRKIRVLNQFPSFQKLDFRKRIKVCLETNNSY